MLANVEILAVPVGLEVTEIDRCLSATDKGTDRNRSKNRLSPSRSSIHERFSLCLVRVQNVESTTVFFGEYISRLLTKWLNKRARSRREPSSISLTFFDRDAIFGSFGASKLSEDWKRDAMLAWRRTVPTARGTTWDFAPSSRYTLIRKPSRRRGCRAGRACRSSGEMARSDHS